MSAPRGVLRGALDGLQEFLTSPQRPEVALQFGTAAICGARIEAVRGWRGLRALASAPLRPGVLAPTLEDPGFRDPDELRGAVRTVLSRLGAEPSARAALVIPDAVARFRLFPLAEVSTEPGRGQELVAFRMQKLLPFAATDARVVTAFPRETADPVVAIGFSSSVVRAYERAAESFGLDVGQVETASMALLRGLAHDGDALLVHHDAAWLSITLVREGWPVSVRSFDREVSGDPDEIRREIASTAVFWRDRLGGSTLASAVVHAADPWSDAIAADIERAFKVRAGRALPPAGLTVAGVPQAVERAATPALTLLGAA